MLICSCTLFGRLSSMCQFSTLTRRECSISDAISDIRETRAGPVYEASIMYRCKMFSVEIVAKCILPVGAKRQKLERQGFMADHGILMSQNVGLWFDIGCCQWEFILDTANSPLRSVTGYTCRHVAAKQIQVYLLGGIHP